MTDPDPTRPTMSLCATCLSPMWWQECPTGGWWIHLRHPADGHDAEEQEAIL